MCTRPSVIHTRKGVMRVPCNHCQDCLNRKSSRQALLCKLEASHYKYCMFGFLSYDMDNVPVARYVRNYNNTGLPAIINVSERMIDDYADTNQVIWSGFLDSHEMTLVDKTFKENKYVYFKENEFPYTSSKESQRFLKRLRYYIGEALPPNADEDVSIRYFIASEYGPQTFRPHFHFLIFTNSLWLCQSLLDFVHKAWPFGYSNCQLSRGSCAEYVSEYTSANSFIPPIHRYSSIRPKSLHSKGLGREKIELFSKKNPDLQYETLANRRVVLGGKELSVSPTLSIQSCVFPKCFGYSETNHLQRLNLYRALELCKRTFGYGYTLRQYAEMMFELLPTLQPTLSQAFSIIYKLKSYDKFNPVSVQTFYGILSTSSLFLRNCKELHLSPEEYLFCIEKYYKDKSLDVLNKWYLDRVENPCASLHQLIFDYDNIDSGSWYWSYQKPRSVGTVYVPDGHKRVVSDLAKSVGLSVPSLLREYSHFNSPKHNNKLGALCQKSRLLANRRLKHKLLQDANGCFSYERPLTF